MSDNEDAANKRLAAAWLKLRLACEELRAVIEALHGPLDDEDDADESDDEL